MSISARRSNYYCCFGPFRGNVLVGSFLIAIFGILLSAFSIGLFIFIKWNFDQQFDHFFDQQIGPQINGTPLEFAFTLFPFILPPILLVHIFLAFSLFFRIVFLLNIYLIVQAIHLAFWFCVQFIAALLLCLHIFRSQYFDGPISFLLVFLIFLLFLFTNSIPIWAFSIVWSARKCVKNRRDIERFRKEQSKNGKNEFIYGNMEKRGIDNFGREDVNRMDYYGEEDDYDDF